MGQEYRESHVVLDSSTTIDQFGVLHGRGKIARIGIQNYMIDGRRVRELRPIDAVSSSAETFEAKPITLNHPISRVVTADNAQAEMKGFTTKPTFEDGWIVADIHVTHADAIEAATTTHNKFSCGYMADIEHLDSPAIWVDSEGIMGQPGAAYEYDAIQKNIVGNHVALVMNPRAGSDATFLDSEDDDLIIISTVNDENDMTKKQQETVETQVTIKVDSDEFVISGQDAEKVQALVAKLDGEVDGLTSQLSEANEQIEVLKSNVVEDAVIAEEVKARVEIWNLVGSKLDSEIDYSLNTTEVKKLYLKSVTPQLSNKIDSASDDYIEALWDIKKPEAESKNDAADANKEVLDKLAKNDGMKKGEQMPDANDMSEDLKKLADARANYFNRKK